MTYRLVVSLNAVVLAAAGTATATSVPVPSAPLGLLDQLMLAFGNFAVAQFVNFEPTDGPLVLL